MALGHEDFLGLMREAQVHLLAAKGLLEQVADKAEYKYSEDCFAHLVDDVLPELACDLEECEQACVAESGDEASGYIPPIHGLPGRSFYSTWL